MYIGGYMVIKTKSAKKTVDLNRMIFQAHKNMDKGIDKVLKRLNNIITKMGQPLASGHKEALNAIYSDFVTLCLYVKSHLLDISATSAKIHADFHKAYTKQVTHEAIYVMQELILLCEYLDIPMHLMQKAINLIVVSSKQMANCLKEAGKMHSFKKFEFSQKGLARIKRALQKNHYTLMEAIVADMS